MEIYINTFKIAIIHKQFILPVLFILRNTQVKKGHSYYLSNKINTWISLLT